MSLDIIRKGFETRLSTWAAGKNPEIKIAFENKSFSQTDGTYIKAYLLPAMTQAPDLQGQTRVFSGVFQVTLVLPFNKGLKAAELLATEIDGLFPVNFEQDNMRITMTAPMSPRPSYADGDRYVMPVSGNYQAVYK